MIASVSYVLNNVESIEVTSTAGYAVVEFYLNDGCSLRQQLFYNEQLISDFEWDLQVEGAPSPLHLIRSHQEEIFFGKEED